MEGVVEFLKGLQLHPFVDHFTVSLIVVGVLIDLVASLAPSRPWLRSMAVTLMALGAVAAAASRFTGGWEAERVWKDVTGPAKEHLRWHAEVGGVLMWVLGGLALWRLGIQFVAFLSRTRVIYLLVAICAGGAILYQGDLGGDLVYEYGIGTALMSKQAPAPEASIAAPEALGPIPTVYVPPPTPAVVSSPAAPAASSSPVVAAPPVPAPSITVPSPATTPAGSVGTEVSPPPGAAAPSSAGSPASKPTTL